MGYEQAVELPGTDPRRIFYNALLCYESRWYPLAIRDLDRVIRMDPFLSPAYVNRALAHLQLLNEGEFEETLDEAIPEILADLTQALRIDPANFFAHYNLGVVFFLTGNTVGAEIAFTKAIETDPFDEISYCMRAEARCDLGRYEEAIRDLEAALMLDPEYEHAQQSLERAKDALDGAA